jgi:hypothetical protein
LAGIATSASISLVRLSTPKMRLHPERAPVALLRLVHLGITRLVGILGGRRRIDDGRIDYLVGGHL